jgi:hypothetical protein
MPRHLTKQLYAGGFDVTSLWEAIQGRLPFGRRTPQEDDTQVALDLLATIVEEDIEFRPQMLQCPKCKCTVVNSGHGSFFDTNRKCPNRWCQDGMMYPWENWSYDHLIA